MKVSEIYLEIFMRFFDEIITKGGTHKHKVRRMFICEILEDYILPVFNELGKSDKLTDAKLRRTFKEFHLFAPPEKLLKEISGVKLTSSGNYWSDYGWFGPFKYIDNFEKRITKKQIKENFNARCFALLFSYEIAKENNR